jgi:hypothetical protein
MPTTVALAAVRPIKIETAVCRLPLIDGIPASDPFCTKDVELFP